MHSSWCWSASASLRNKIFRQMRCVRRSSSPKHEACGLGAPPAPAGLRRPPRGQRPYCLVQPSAPEDYQRPAPSRNQGGDGPRHLQPTRNSTTLKLGWNSSLSSPFVPLHFAFLLPFTFVLSCPSSAGACTT